MILPKANLTLPLDESESEVAQSCSTLSDPMALGSITMNKASGGDGIPVELFQILKDDAVKVLHSVCQQNWKTQE